MRSPRRWAHSRRALTVVVLASSVSACAALWGFQDGVPLRDSGADEDVVEIDATALDGPSSADVTVADAAVDAPAADGGPDDDGGDGDGGGSASDGADDGGPIDDADAAIACPGACVPTPVDPGWLGPFLALEVTDGGALPSCAGPSFVEGVDLFASPDAAPPTCDCRCAPPSNVSCSPIQGAFSTDRMCATACAAARVSIGACTAIPPAPMQCGGNARLSFAPGTPDGGSCVATANVDASPIAWGAKTRLCAPSASAGICEQGGTCMPSSGPAPSAPAYCVVRAGTWTCPGAYPAPHTYGDGGTPYIGDAGDSRSCTCSCGAPTGLACNEHVTLFDSGTCSGAGVALEAGACAVPAMEFASGVSTPADAGSCAPFGGPTGGLALTDSYTVCCTE